MEQQFLPLIASPARLPEFEEIPADPLGLDVGHPRNAMPAFPLVSGVGSLSMSVADAKEAS